MERSLHKKVFIFLFLLFIVFPLSANSQLILPVISPSISFILTPLNPEPGDVVNVEIESFSLDLDRSSIDWFVDGKRIAIGAGLDSIKTKVGGLGTETVVSVVIRPDEITEILEQISIIPSYVSILWEAETYTPPFYKGRALPGSGANIFVEANANFVKTDGNKIPNSDLVFTWKKDGAIIKKSSGLGRSYATLVGPTLFGEDIISVDVVSTDNKFSGSSLIRIPSVEPYVSLYKDDPLLGVMYHQAIGERTSIPGTDITLAAAPYYTSIKNPDDPNLSYTWEVNGQSVTTDPRDPFRIILRLAGGLVGTANISLDISHIENFLQSVNIEWSLSISDESPEQGDPFFRQVN